MLGGEYEAFRAEYEKPHRRGIRLNTLKCDAQTLAETLPFPLVPSPFSRCRIMPPRTRGWLHTRCTTPARSIRRSRRRPRRSRCSIRSPGKGCSTSAPRRAENRRRSRRSRRTAVCCGRMVVRSRASVLASNLERMGVKNAVVSSVYPDMLAEKLAGYFDRVLVDAPCSGEGMFRRDPAAVQGMEPCARRDLRGPPACNPEKRRALCACGRRTRLFDLHVLRGGKRRRCAGVPRREPGLCAREAGSFLRPPGLWAGRRAHFPRWTAARGISRRASGTQRRMRAPCNRMRGRRTGGRRPRRVRFTTRF